MEMMKRREPLPAGFSLRVSAGPIAWARGASPKSAIRNETVIVVEREGDHVVTRQVRADGRDNVILEADIAEADHAGWLRRTFREHDGPASWDDPVIARLAKEYPGLASFTDGSLFAGLLTSIIGQSISIASAMAAQRRLAASFHPGIGIDGRTFHPLPDAHQLADATVDLIRSSGVTWKRAEAIRAIAREVVAGNLPEPGSVDESEIRHELRALPLVGLWTAASALLWGLGAPDAYPGGDVALLRAARLAYDQDGMTMKDLDSIAGRWRPHRGVATRLLWTGLLGPGW
jgi:DNA-3-methyladenine glycosylase II